MKPVVVETGRKAGRLWNELNSADVETLADIESALPNGIWDYLVIDDVYTPAERLCFLLMGIDEFNRDRGDAADLWESVFGESQPDVDLLYGFANDVLAASEQPA